MARLNETKRTEYREDGSVIPDLRLSEKRIEQLRNALERVGHDVATVA